MHFLTEGIHSLCWVGYVKIKGNIAASISVSCSFRKQSSLREGPTVFWVVYCTFHHNGNTKYPIPSRYSWLGIAWALFLRRCPDSHCPQSTHCLGVMLLQHPPCSSYSWALSGSVEKWVNLHVSKLLWVCFPLGDLNLFIFLLLEMKTELYGCIQLWLTLVLRSAWTEARFTPLARPGNQPGVKHSQCRLFHQLWEAPWTVSTPLKLCHGGLPS